jgi:uncharacterized protein (DUF342 family)
MFDNTISLGQIINGFFVLIGGAIILGMMRSKVETLTADMQEMKKELHQLSSTTVALARVEEKIRALRESGDRLERLWERQHRRERNESEWPRNMNRDQDED